MVTTKLNLSMTEPQVRQIYAKQGDTGRVLDISLDQTPEDGTLRILRPDGVEVTSEAVTGGEVSESGETVTFESMTEADVTELTVGIEPVQDLNGYDTPWVGGAGKNKLQVTAVSTVINGITFTVNDNGTVVINGTATADAALTLNTYTLKAGTAIIYGGAVGGSASTYWVVLSGYPKSGGYDITADRTSATTDWTNAPFQLVVASGVTVTNRVVYPMIRLASETDPTWQPYSNICPITGHDEVTVNFGAEQGTADETYTTSLGQTVYGGTLDLVSGVLTVTHAIATISNFGTLTNYTSSGGLYYSQYSVNSVAEGASISSMLTQKTTSGGYSSTTECFSNEGNRLRVYTNATTDASFRTKFADLQIVYPLTTPTVINLTPQQIKTLVGTNNVWASSGDIVSIKFAYGGLLSELPSDATSIVGKCYCDVEQNGVSSMPFTLNVKKNERAT